MWFRKAHAPYYLDYGYRFDLSLLLLVLGTHQLVGYTDTCISSNVGGGLCCPVWALKLPPLLPVAWFRFRESILGGLGEGVYWLIAGGYEVWW